MPTPKRVLAFLIVQLATAALALILIMPAEAAGTAPLGASCQSNGDCASNDCEKSDLQLNGNNFCDCIAAVDCKKQYGAPAGGGDWQCLDGDPYSFDLDYCQSTNGELHLPVNLDYKKLPIGSACNSDNDCLSNDCEESDIKENGKNKWFCDCGDKYDCYHEYGAPSKGGGWSCEDGADITHDIDYCLSDKGEQQLPLSGQGKSGLSDFLFDTEVAKTGLLNEIKTLKPSLSIRLPGLEFSDAENNIDDQGYLHLPWIGEFIAAVYKFGVAVSSIVAVIMIVIQGVLIITSGGGEQKTAAYKRIGQIIVGLFIAWGSYAILYNINPDLVKFKSFKIKYVEPVPLTEDAQTVEETAAEVGGFTIAPAGKIPIPTTIVCDDPTSPTSGLVPLEKSPGLKLPAPATAYLNPSAAAALKKAGEIAAKEGYLLQVVSACRSLATQLQKAQSSPDSVKAGTIAKPGGSPHGFGIAVDIQLIKDNKVLVPSGGSDKMCLIKPEYVRKLSEIMYAAGFYRLGIENWHFELPPKNNYCRVKDLYDPAPCRKGSNKVPCITK